MSDNRYIYRYDQFVVKKTLDGGYVVVNTNAQYECHSHVKDIRAGKALCKLAAKRKLPRNMDLYFIESLIRLSNNTKYLIELKNLKRMIEENPSIVAIKPKKEKHDIKKVIDQGINEYFDETQ